MKRTPPSLHSILDDPVAQVLVRDWLGQKTRRTLKFLRSASQSRMKRGSYTPQCYARIMSELINIHFAQRSLTTLQFRQPSKLI